jgi:hypothetical protein
MSASPRSKNGNVFALRHVKEASSLETKTRRSEPAYLHREGNRMQENSAEAQMKFFQSTSLSNAADEDEVSFYSFFTTISSP